MLDLFTKSCVKGLILCSFQVLIKPKASKYCSATGTWEPVCVAGVADTNLWGSSPFPLQKDNVRVSVSNFTPPNTLPFAALDEQDLHIASTARREPIPCHELEGLQCHSPVSIVSLVWLM